MVTKMLLIKKSQAVEFVDRPAVELVLKHQSTARDPFDNKYPFYVLIETSGSNDEHDTAVCYF